MVLKLVIAGVDAGGGAWVVLYSHVLITCLAKVWRREAHGVHSVTCSQLRANGNKTRTTIEVRSTFFGGKKKTERRCSLTQKRRNFIIVLQSSSPYAELRSWDSSSGLLQNEVKFWVGNRTP